MDHDDSLSFLFLFFSFLEKRAPPKQKNRPKNRAHPPLRPHKCPKNRAHPPPVNHKFFLCRAAFIGQVEGRFSPIFS